MCGISGIINFNLKKDILTSRINFGLKSLYHRGPDEQNFYVDDGIGLGTVRLSIENIQNGKQPKVDIKNHLIAGFNGEIFNYKFLIKKYNFPNNFSEIDTILELYKIKGKLFLEELEGQFAIYIYCKKKNSLLLARDRNGIRPLYYHQEKENFYFASEIKSIFNLAKKTFLISPKALSQTCLFWTCVNEETSFNEIKQLEPGKYLVFQKSKLKKFNYNYKNTTKLTTNKLNLYDEIENAVKRQLQSDVGFACYLSGGIDSAVLAYFLNKNSKKKLDTFSISFENDQYDESLYQNIISKHLNTNHHQVKITNKDIANNFFKVVNFAENFLFRTAPVPMYLLSNMVNKNNHKVVFTGEGADEVFYGYDIFFENRIRKFWSRNKKSKIRPNLFKKLYSYLPQFNNPRYFQLSKDFYYSFLNEPNNIFFSHLTRWSQYDKIKDFFKIDSISKNLLINSFKKNLEINFKSYDLNTKTQKIEMKTLLSNYLLSSQGDRMTMANSVEGRYPFLDDVLINKLKNTDPNFLAPGVKSKLQFRKTFEKYLPKEIVFRDKFAYQAPEAHAFFGPNYKSDIFLDFQDNLNNIDLIHKKNFSNLLKKIEHPMSSQRLGFRENMTFVIALSLHCLLLNSKKWIINE